MQVTNKLILGTVQFGLKYGINNRFEKPTQTEVNEILSFAFRAGITCLDTAEAYGDAHKIIGNFHNSYPNISFDIITKLPHLLDDQIFDKVDNYIEDLKVEKLKALLFHSFDTYIQNEKMVLKLAELKEQRKVGLSGVSVYTNEQAEVVMDDQYIDIIQIPFNMFDNETKRGNLLRKAKNKGKIIHTRSVFLQGLFFSSGEDKRKVVTLLKPGLDAVRALSSQTGYSIQQLALNYCLQQNYIDQTLIGVDNINQLKENINDSELDIPDHLIASINAIDIKDPDLLNPSLWTM